MLVRKTVMMVVSKRARVKSVSRGRMLRRLRRCRSRRVARGMRWEKRMRAMAWTMSGRWGWAREGSSRFTERR